MDEKKRKSKARKEKKNGLSDKTKVNGIPWSKLKHKLVDDNWDIDAFYKDLSKKDREMLERLEKA